MFSMKEKQEIAKVIEEKLLSLNHPEMPKEKPLFNIHIKGKEPWSWANILPNWFFTDDNPPSINPWNENVRKETQNDRDQTN